MKIVKNPAEGFKFFCEPRFGRLVVSEGFFSPCEQVLATHFLPADSRRDLFLVEGQVFAFD